MEKEPVSKGKKKKRRGLKILGVLFLLFSLAVLSVGLFFYVKSVHFVLLTSHLKRLF